MTMKFVGWVWSLVSISFLITISTETKAHPESKLLNDDGNCDNDNGFPICATNGTENILFANECALNEALEFRKELKKTVLKNCLHKCRFYCVSIYEPICAVDPNDNSKRTFHNRCELVKNGCILDKDWKFYKNGICYESGSKKKNRNKRNTNRKRGDPIPCPKVFNPVCATLAGVKSTFINECLLNAENVKFKREWEIISEGMCAEDYSYYTPRSHKNKRTFAETQFDRFNERLFLDDNFRQVRAPPTFQTHFIKDPTKHLISDRHESFKYPPIYQIPNLKNTRGENLQSTHKYQADNAFKVQEETYKDFDTAISDFLRNLQKNFKAKNSDHFVDTSNCKLGSVPLCCKFQGNKHTFKNICEVNLHNENTGQDWIIYYEGECNDCDIHCPRSFEPVCASRKGLNYTIRNECLLKSTMCQDTFGDWKFLKKGICDDNELKIIRDKYESKPLGFQFSKTSKKSSMTLQNIKETTTETKPTFSLTTNTYFSELTTNFDKLDTTKLSSQDGTNNLIPNESTTHITVSKNGLKTPEILKNKPNTFFDIMIKYFSFLMPAHKNIKSYSLSDINFPFNLTSTETIEDFSELKAVKAKNTSENSIEISIIQPRSNTSSLPNDN